MCPRAHAPYCHPRRQYRLQRLQLARLRGWRCRPLRVRLVQEEPKALVARQQRVPQQGRPPIYVPRRGDARGRQAGIYGRTLRTLRARAAWLMDNTLTRPQLLDRLGYSDNEHVSINTQAPGGHFTSTSQQHDDVPDAADLLTTDAWFGVNPVTPRAHGRGGADDVTRLAAIYADLDIKPGGITSYEQGLDIIDDLSLMLGTRPVAVTLSGHGLQPLWAVDDEPLTDDNRATAKATLRRFGRLVASVADARGAAVDSVFDLARVLRIPGTLNHKSDPVGVVTTADNGRPLTLDEIIDTLGEYSVPEYDDDGATLGETINDPEGWERTEHACPYAKSVIKEWRQDTPDARHPWLVSGAVRLAAMHAHGCLSREEHIKGRTVLTERFRQLLTNPPARDEARGEVPDAFTWGVQQAATMTPERIARELGGHDPVEPSRLVSPATPAVSTDGNLATVHPLHPAPDRALHPVPA